MTKVQTLGDLYAMIERQDPALFADDVATDGCEEMPVVAADAGSGTSSLSIYERGEVLRKRDIYYIPRRRAAGGDGAADGRTINIKNYGDNFGFDDAQGNYVIVPGDHINYRYEIARVLGNGSFGNVVECSDHKWRRKSQLRAGGDGEARERRGCQRPMESETMEGPLEGKGRLEGERPLAEGKRPLAEGTRPLAEDKKPIAESEKPIAESQRPIAESERLIAESERLIAEDEKPIAESALRRLVAPLAPLAAPLRRVAVKIIKNDLNWSLQAVYEIKMLKHLNEHGGSPHILRYLGHFHFRGHMCIATEVLSLNLFLLLEISAFKGFAMAVLRPLTTQILLGLDFIHTHDVIHCDIKPENIMVRLPRSPHDALVVKIIDFGLSCFKHEILYLYIQSRYYRAPEVVLGATYTYKIDIWSFGCVVAELYTGTPLLPGRSELEQIAMMLEVFGAPGSQLVVGYRRALMEAARAPAALAPGARAMPRLDERSIKRTLVYSLFDADGKINMQLLNLRLQALGGARRAVKLSSKVLEVMFKIGADSDKAEGASFVKMMKSVFQWDPLQRLLAAELLQSAFITESNRRTPAGAR